MTKRKFFRLLILTLFILSTGFYLVEIFRISYFTLWPDWITDAAIIVSESIFAGFIIRKVGIKRRPHLLFLALLFFAGLWLFMGSHTEFLQGSTESIKWYVYVLGYFLFLPIFITVLFILRHGPKIIFNSLRLVYKGLIYTFRRFVREPFWALKIFGGVGRSCLYYFS